jgi:hypothetical protein
MRDKLIEVCANEFENYIKGLFKNPKKIPNTGMAEIPIVGGLYIPDLMDEASPLLLTVCKALVARERFRQDAPDWPILPLHERDIEAAIESDYDPRINLVGLYSYSLRGADWNFDVHPSFDRYARGLMDYECTPDRVRNDSYFWRRFPPTRLEGLCDGDLCWFNPEQLALDRENLARIAIMEAREAAEARMGAG